MNQLSAAALVGSDVEVPDLALPLGLVGTQQSAIIRQETVDFALGIGGLSPDTTAAGKHFNLLAQFLKEQAGAVVIGLEVKVDFVCLVDGVEGLLDLPEAAGFISLC